MSTVSYSASQNTYPCPPPAQPNSANDDQEGEMDEDDSELAAAPQLVPATADGVGAGLAAVSLDETGDGDDDDDGAAAAAEEDDGWTVVTPKKGGKKR